MEKTEKKEIVIEKGKIISGKVTGIEDYGIFVRINDKRSGLIHISEISNRFVRNINDYANIDEMIDVMVLSDENSNDRIKLSIKDIDYRKNNIKEITKTEITSEFLELQKNMKIWIDEKSEEIMKKKS